VSDQTVTVAGNGAYPSPSFTPTQAGTYYWTATYTGDAANTGAATGCGGQHVTITAALYWTNPLDGTIWQADPDGSNPQAIATGQTGPVGVAVSP